MKLRCGIPETKSYYNHFLCAVVLDEFPQDLIRLYSQQFIPRPLVTLESKPTPTDWYIQDFAVFVVKHLKPWLRKNTMGLLNTIFFTLNTKESY